MHDHVILSAGSAGYVLADRLGEDRDVKVALIEVGPPDDEPEIHTPAAWPPLRQSRFDWDVWNEPEPSLNERRSYLPRGAAPEPIGPLSPYGRARTPSACELHDPFERFTLPPRPPPVTPAYWPVPRTTFHVSAPTVCPFPASTHSVR